MFRSAFLVRRGGQFELVEALVLGLLRLDVAADTPGVPAHRVHEKASRPQVLARVVALAFEEVSRHVDGAFALDVSDDAGHRQLGRDAQEHVDVIGQDVALFDAKERFAPVLGDENNVVFAVPFGMRKTLVVLHGFFRVVVALDGSQPTPHGGLHEKSNLREPPRQSRGISYWIISLPPMSSRRVRGL